MAMAVGAQVEKVHGSKSSMPHQLSAAAKRNPDSVFAARRRY
jgi:hypothetical protein